MHGRMEYSGTKRRRSIQPTAEPILSEAAAVLGTADDVLRMIETGDHVLSLDLAKEVSPIRALILKYKDQST